MGAIKSISSIFRYINHHPLAGKHKLQAYYKFFRWQITSRIFKGPHRVPFVGDTVLVADRSMKGATGNIYLGLHDFSEMSFVLHFLRPDDCFFDVGANVGSYSVLAAGVARAKAFSFEPVPQTFRSLERNVKENDLQTFVNCVNAGVGAKEEMLYFTSLNDSVNHVVSEGSISDFTKVVKVPIVKLDDYASGPAHAILIKIDVEGFETEVLNGMPLLLQNQALKGIIIELNGSGSRYGYDENDIHANLLHNGFEPYNYDPYSRGLEKQSTFGKFNTIYLRDVDFIKERLQNSPKAEVFSERF